MTNPNVSLLNKKTTIYIIAILISALLLYPVFVFELSGKQVPPSWQLESLKSIRTVGEIQTLLADDGLSMFAGRAWLEKHWWGKKELVVRTGADTPSKDDKISSIDYLITINRFDGDMIIYRLDLRSNFLKDNRSPLLFGEEEKYFLLIGHAK